MPVANALDDLVDLLDLEPIEVNIFRGVSPDENRQRVFGGQVAGQALVAAARTVEPTGTVHSLHAYFLRPGDPTVPILYEVDRIRDGRSFTTRRVVAIQHGKAIFNLSARSTSPRPASTTRLPMPDGAADPETLPDFHERMAPYREQLGDWYDRPRPIDIRYVDDAAPIERRAARAAPRQQVWLRADGTLPDDPRAARLRRHLRVGHDPARHHAAPPRRRAGDEDRLMMASLDHAMWFHRPFRADEWLLYDQDTPSTSGGAGPRPWARSSPATARWSSRWCRRA